MDPMQVQRRGGDLLALGFGATVATWAMLYVAAIPAVGAGARVVLAAGTAAVLFAAGLIAGRRAGRGAAGGAAVGAIVTAVSLLVLASFLAGREGASLGRAAMWLGGLLVAAAGLGAAGAAVGRREVAGRAGWTSALAWVTAATVLLMLVAGGIVTGLEAGLAVDGWLGGEAELIVFFPVSRMQRDMPTFVEHAHRLWGLLVGLTTIVLAVHVWMVDARGRLRALALLIVAAVVAQGVLGGARVTEQNTAVGIVHGVFAQVIFAALVGLAVTTSTTWRSDRTPSASLGAGTDRLLLVLLVAAVLLQVTLGTFFRHLQPDPGVPRGALMGLLHGHSFVGSLIVVALATTCGARAWGRHADQPPLKRTGVALIHVMGLQILLGIAAFIVVPKSPGPREEAIPVQEVVITTAHQVTGALLLATAAALLLWQRRLIAR